MFFPRAALAAAAIAAAAIAACTRAATPAAPPAAGTASPNASAEPADVDDTGPATTVTRDDPSELKHEGKQSITVVERPPNVAAPKPPPAPPLSDADCRAKPTCATEGRCSARNESCEAVGPAECALLDACQSRPCHIVDGGCVAAMSCKDSAACREQGLCSERDGECVAQTDADCGQARACGASKCHAVDGACVAVSDADCPKSTRARNGECVVDCRHSSACAKDGLCDEAPAAAPKAKANPARCVSASDADCAASAACASRGACVKSGESCRPRDDTHCAGSRECRQFGRCTFVNGHCAARSEAECKAADIACKAHGRCKYDATTGCVR